ncbi:Uncharacterized protein dnm_035880 [Desulfonema magnum]|uniref:Uncharacterized protein n=1 Tax=Desulfonema magnum TaxID=45655 RepID=A0A975GNA0_9BACT|nr:Uncharacterized protein dnm_035880 [Desulfonema magnum]
MDPYHSKGMIKTERRSDVHIFRSGRKVEFLGFATRML